MFSYDCVFFFFKQKTAYEMRISDWSSDVCSSDLEVGDADLAREGAVRQRDAVEDGLVVADEVHLVHRQHDMLDAEQVREEAVAARLREHALARVNQDHGKVGGRSAGDHVARILLVPRGVGDYELGLLCVER